MMEDTVVEEGLKPLFSETAEALASLYTVAAQPPRLANTAHYMGVLQGAFLTIAALAEEPANAEAAAALYRHCIGAFGTYCAIAALEAFAERYDAPEKQQAADRLRSYVEEIGLEPQIPFRAEGFFVGARELTDLLQEYDARRFGGIRTL